MGTLPPFVTSPTFHLKIGTFSGERSRKLDIEDEDWNKNKICSLQIKKHPVVIIQNPQWTILVCDGI